MGKVERAVYRHVVDDRRDLSRREQDAGIQDDTDASLQLDEQLAAIRNTILTPTERLMLGR